jgi:hypothetical protein
MPRRIQEFRIPPLFFESPEYQLNRHSRAHDVRNVSLTCSDFFPADRECWKLVPILDAHLSISRTLRGVPTFPSATPADAFFTTFAVE